MAYGLVSLAAVALGFVAAPSGSSGEDVLSRHFGRPGDCWLRAYDAEHLSRNPAQRVTRFDLARTYGQTEAGPEPNPPGEVHLALRARTRGGTAPLTGLGICLEESATVAEARCGIESDGGGFRLQPSGQGLRLTADARAILSFGDGPSIDLGQRLEDRVIELARAPASVCADQ